MPDNLEKRGPKDSKKINVNESWEVKYWCTKFGCTKTQLLAAVKAVGVSAAVVKKHLSK
jgi:hypothetical protein